MTAVLLVMDVHRRNLDRFDPQGETLERLVAAVDGARRHHLAVVFARVAFRPGFPEVSENNKIFAAIEESGRDYTIEGEMMQIHPAIEPLPGEPVVIKRRVSAFTGSDLQVVLRSLHASHLVLGGIATSGVVLSTLREAADLDFELTVLRDACADADADVQRVLMDKVFPLQAQVASVADWVRGVGATK